MLDTNPIILGECILRSVGLVPVLELGSSFDKKSHQQTHNSINQVKEERDKTMTRRVLSILENQRRQWWKQINLPTLH